MMLICLLHNKKYLITILLQVTAPEQFPCVNRTSSGFCVLPVSPG